MFFLEPSGNPHGAGQDSNGNTPDALVSSDTAALSQFVVVGASAGPAVESAASDETDASDASSTVASGQVAVSTDRIDETFAGLPFLDDEQADRAEVDPSSELNGSLFGRGLGPALSPSL